ncbi:alpha/beta hydrolase [Microbacterium marinilacus]|uniref:Alpha/beta hydrolase n=1 Tax=Microbacterium marinilacus TaxID=415209 RepID=A0ABP7BAH4_9MICO|nr:alpha/beta hydrolase [Microbacterium marinilacus]MBY0686990.1 alpha/beta hydrolase [Microbacterium marinilacus]
MSDGWVTDVLGEGYERLTLPLRPDEEGEVVATVVRHLPTPRRPGRPRRLLEDVDVLYVHGWSDYFFQRRLARFWADRGARFFALDLRKYGRSLREWQTPGYVADLETYDEDIRAALDARGPSTGRRLVLLGHSTGGLVLSLWAARHPREVSALVLNSPWLEFQLSAVARAALSPVVELRARLRPLDAIRVTDHGFYARAQEEAADPEDPVSIDASWRPVGGFPVYAGWLDAILAGHTAVSKGLGIPAPVCVLLSARSTLPTRWSDDLTRSDTVLFVDDIARAALRLGRSVTVERIEGSLHDVFLSRPEARVDAYERLDRWARGFAASRPRG